MGENSRTFQELMKSKGLLTCREIYQSERAVSTSRQYRLSSYRSFAASDEESAGRHIGLCPVSRF